jgi:hypothetical protein
MLSQAANYQRMQQKNNQSDRNPYYNQYKPAQRSHSGEELLGKLEKDGKVPSREKFRRMCCQVF